MTGFFEALLIKLFIALGDKLITEGSEYFKEWKAIKDNAEKALNYQKVVDSPAKREERKRAEDEALS